MPYFIIVSLLIQLMYLRAPTIRFSWPRPQIHFIGFLDNAIQTEAAEQPVIGGKKELEIIGGKVGIPHLRKAGNVVFDGRGRWGPLLIPKSLVSPGAGRCCERDKIVKTVSSAIHG